MKSEFSFKDSNKSTRVLTLKSFFESLNLICNVFNVNNNVYILLGLNMDWTVVHFSLGRNVYTFSFNNPFYNLFFLDIYSSDLSSRSRTTSNVSSLIDRGR